MLELQKGRPQSCEGRLEKEIRVYDFLDAAGVEYQRVDHEAADTIEACKEIDKVLNAMICKNLFLCNRQKTKFYLLMLPGYKKLCTKELSRQLGVPRLMFADREYMERFLDITPGSVSVMGLMNDTGNEVKLVVDGDVLKDEYFGCHPCINTSSLRLKTKDMFYKLLPLMKHDMTVVEI